MIALLAGAGLLLVLLGAADAFSRAKVPTIRSLLSWVAALAVLSLGTLLLLSGRWPAALASLTMFGPLGWNWWQSRHQRTPGAGGASAGPRRGGPPRDGPMTRAEAWSVLGLAPGASEKEIRDAHRRLMRVSHPDNGGSDWLAARVNQARDLLLERPSQTRGGSA